MTDSKLVRGGSRAVIGYDIHGEKLFSEVTYTANAADVGSMGRGIAASGYAISGAYVELNAGLTFRKVIAVNNTGGDTVYLGPSGNGIDNMYPMPGSGGQISLNVTSGVRIYGITDGTEVNVRILEIG